MIEMHDGNCQPFTINRQPGREHNPQAWDIPNGRRIKLKDPVLGWRVEPYAHNGQSIQGVGGFRPAPPGESPFGTGINSLPPAKCHGKAMLAGPEAHKVEGNVNTRPHKSPDTDCTCGYRIVHDVADTATYLGKHSADFHDRLTPTPQGMARGVALVAVRGGLYTCRSVEFRNMRDPEGTLRVSHVAMEPLVILEDPDAARMFRRLGVTAHLVTRVANTHEAHRCHTRQETQ